MNQFQKSAKNRLQFENHFEFQVSIPISNLFVFYVFLHDSMSNLKDKKNRLIYLPISAAGKKSKTARDSRYV